MFKKLTNVLVLFLVCLLLSCSNASLNTHPFAFLQHQSTTQKIEREAENKTNFKGISKIIKENLLSAFEKVYCDNEEIDENENSNTNSPVYLANKNLDNGFVFLHLDKKSSSLLSTFDLEIQQHNRLFILFHSWKFHLI
jgi:hypothetical protein